MSFQSKDRHGEHYVKQHSGVDKTRLVSATRRKEGFPEYKNKIGVCFSLYSKAGFSSFQGKAQSTPTARAVSVSVSLHVPTEATIVRAT